MRNYWKLLGKDGNDSAARKMHFRYILAVLTVSAIFLTLSFYTVLVESDDDYAPPPSYMAGMDRRRKSVFAESYEPGQDDEAVEKVCYGWLNYGCTTLYCLFVCCLFVCLL